MRDQQVAEIRLYPVRWDGDRGRLRLHDDLRIHVEFVPDEDAQPRRRGPEGESGGWDRYRRLQRQAVINPGQLRRGAAPGSDVDSLQESALSPPLAFMMSGGTPPLKIYVDEDGLYGISPADLSAAGISTAGLTANGRP